MKPILVHPTYFPSIAHMVAIAQAESVVFEVAGNYQKQSYRNRTTIAHSNGKLTLTVPIKHTQDGKRKQTKDIRIENDFPWQSQHWKSLQSAYRTSPYFEYYEDDLAILFEKSADFLLDHNLVVFEHICEVLGTNLSVAQTAEYLKEPLQQDLRHLAIARKEKEYKLEPYTQVLQPEGDFLSNLSILDLLFNEGTNALSYLERQNLDY